VAHRVRTVPWDFSQVEARCGYRRQTPPGGALEFDGRVRQPGTQRDTLVICRTP
jgi:hypothetical protein